MPFDERIEMVRSCKYVDEAIKLPLDFCGTRDMFKIYHFDVQFSGSDYEHDPAWLAEKEFLEKNGSTMVFFPYTQSTSSITSCAIQRLSLPPLKDIYTGNPFWNTFLIRILAAFTTSILDSHLFIAIFSPRISDR